VLDRWAVGSLGLLVLLLCASIAAPLLSPYDPLAVSVRERLLAPGAPGHLLGTDEQGRDLLTRLLYGGRLSLLTGILPVVVAGAIATVVGTLSGYVGGVLGAVLMRVIDVSYAFPAILLAVMVAAALGPGTSNAIIALSFVFVPPISRVAEAATRQVVVQEYIEAARMSGGSAPQIILQQIVPNILGPIVVYAASSVGLSIVIASGLSFLGLGVPPPTPEWGSMLNSLRGAIYEQPLIVLLPGACIFITSAACNLLSSGLSNALDVRRS
jgi:peptide/nickel transport system permease protein